MGTGSGRVSVYSASARMVGSTGRGIALATCRTFLRGPPLPSCLVNTCHFLFRYPKCYGTAGVGTYWKRDICFCGLFDIGMLC